MMRRANQLVTSSKKLRHVMGLGADFTHLLARRHGACWWGWLTTQVCTQANISIMEDLREQAQALGGSGVRARADDAPCRTYAHCACTAPQVISKSSWSSCSLTQTPRARSVEIFSRSLLRACRIWSAWGRTTPQWRGERARGNVFACPLTPAARTTESSRFARTTWLAPRRRPCRVRRRPP